MHRAELSTGFTSRLQIRSGIRTHDAALSTCHLRHLSAPSAAAANTRKTPCPRNSGVAHPPHSVDLESFPHTLLRPSSSRIKPRCCQVDPQAHLSSPRSRAHALPGLRALPPRHRQAQRFGKNSSTPPKPFSWSRSCLRCVSDHASGYGRHCGTSAAHDWRPSHKQTPRTS